MDGRGSLIGVRSCDENPLAQTGPLRESSERFDGLPFVVFRAVFPYRVGLAQELRLLNAGGNADTDTIVRGNEAFLAAAEKRHNPPGAKDVDAPKESSSE